MAKPKTRVNSVKGQCAGLAAPLRNKRRWLLDGQPLCADFIMKHDVDTRTFNALMRLAEDAYHTNDTAEQTLRRAVNRDYSNVRGIGVAVQRNIAAFGLAAGLTQASQVMPEIRSGKAAQTEAGRISGVGIGETFLLFPAMPEEAEKLFRDAVLQLHTALTAAYGEAPEAVETSTPAAAEEAPAAAEEAPAAPAPEPAPEPVASLSDAQRRVMEIISRNDALGSPIPVLDAPSRTVGWLIEKGLGEKVRVDGTLCLRLLPEGERLLKEARENA